MERDRSDPNNLDNDNDGVACETLPRRGTANGGGTNGITTNGLTTNEVTTNVVTENVVTDNVVTDNDAMTNAVTANVITTEMKKPKEPTIINVPNKPLPPTGGGPCML